MPDMSADLSKLLLSESPDALILATSDGNVLSWNAGAQSLFGYTAEEAIGQSLMKLVLSPLQHQDGESIRQSLLNAGSLTYEALRHSKDGTLVFVAISARYVPPQGHEPGYIITNIKDITQQCVLRDATLLEERYRDLLEPTPDAIVFSNNTGRIVLVNGRAEQLFGYDRKFLLGKPVEVLIPSRFHTGHRHSRVQFFGNPHPRTRAMGEGGELYGMTRAGQEFPVEVSLTPIKFGDSMMVMSSIRDISDRVRLESTRALLASIVETSQDAIISIDFNAKITSWNHGAEMLFGYTASEMIGMPISLLRPTHLPADDKTLLEQIHAGHRIDQYEAIRVRKDGRLVDVLLTLSPIRERSGKIIGASKTARDMTERKRLENLVREKQVLEQASRAKDQFLATMSHELRTPLNAVIGFTGTLLMRLPGPLNSEQEKQLKTIRGSARHLLSLINDLLDLARIESGKIELSMEPVHCQAIVNEVAEMLAPAAREKGIAFEVSMPQEPVILNSDRRALHQILLNLANNAVKFTSAGSVKIELLPPPEQGKTSSLFRVTDTGIGIETQELARLFHAFAQVGPAARRREEGTGLGLYLSQKLAELVNGSITCQSEPDQGSVFTLNITHWGSAANQHADPSLQSSP